MVSLLCHCCKKKEYFLPIIHSAGYSEFSIDDLTNSSYCELMFHSKVANYQMGTFHIDFHLFNCNFYTYYGRFCNDPSYPLKPATYADYPFNYDYPDLAPDPKDIKFEDFIKGAFFTFNDNDKFMFEFPTVAEFLNVFNNLNPNILVDDYVFFLVPKTFVPITNNLSAFIRFCKVYKPLSFDVAYHRLKNRAINSYDRLLNCVPNFSNFSDYCYLFYVKKQDYYYNKDYYANL